MDHLRLLRPHQWIKNLFVLMPGFIASGSGMPIPWVQILFCVAAFCLASSSIYIVNDIFDAERDRAHPTKRHRPIASGSIPAMHGWILAGLLAAGAAALSLAASGASLGFVVAYVALNVAYSVWTKHVPLLDCGSIALGFSLRFLAGAAGFGVPATPTLLSACFFGAFAMALVKRRIELSTIEPGAQVKRAALKGLNLQVLDLLVSVFGSVSMTLYAQWAISHPKSLAIFTQPLLVIVVSRVVWLAYLNKKGEDFAKTLLSDPFCLVVAILFVGSVALAIHA